MRTHCDLSAALVMGPGVTQLAHLHKVPQHVLHRTGTHELMGFSEVEPSQSAPGASTAPPDLKDTPDTRRLLRLLGRLDSPRIKLVLRLVAFLLPG
jgi:hypothetical protein